MSGFNDFGNFAGKILADTWKLRQVRALPKAGF